MKKTLLTSLFICLAIMLWAQDAKQLHENGRKFMRQGDFSNAILVLNRAAQIQPDNLEIAKDLGLNYYFAKDYKKALDIYKPLLERKDADDQVFQVGADIQIALRDTKEAEKTLKKGIKKFPKSGPLYNELGETLWAQQDYNAIKEWEKGIEMDPGFGRNYYNAAKYYFFTTDRVWSLIYGEIFLNIDPMGAQAPEIKNILLDGYKKLFENADIEKGNKDKNAFAAAFLKLMNRQSALLNNGINAETLTMVRTRFILDWNQEYKTKYPFKLFEWQNQLLQEGLFDAYNQWIFTAAQNLPAYQNWTNLHPKEYTDLTRFQKGRIFKIPAGQYYH